MTKIKGTLSDIDRIINEVEAYKRDLQRKVSRLIEELVNAGVSIARVQVKQFDAVYTGELLNSIKGYFDSDSGIGYVRAEADYAIFVEYGTGIIGRQYKHPTASKDGWIYDVNNHGEAGWTYFNPNDGVTHWTQGYESRPFMYHTSKELRDDVVKIGKKVFGID